MMSRVQFHVDFCAKILVQIVRRKGEIQSNKILQFLLQSPEAILSSVEKKINKKIPLHPLKCFTIRV